MKRAALIAIWCVGVVAMAWVVWTHPGRDRVDKLQAELQNLKSENQRIAHQNRELRRRIEALRSDPRALRRRARISAGLARPDELILQFDEQRTGGRLQVQLTVGSDQLKLAGRTFNMAALDDQLSRARRDFPTATLDVQFGEQIDPRRRRVVLDTVRASAFRYTPEETDEDTRSVEPSDERSDDAPDEG